MFGLMNSANTLGEVMVDFTVSVPNHRKARLPAKTCSACRGLGYVTGKPQRIMVTKLENPPVTKAMVANPGDRCLTCCGRGWIGLIGSAHQPMPPPIPEGLDVRRR